MGAYVLDDGIPHVLHAEDPDGIVGVDSGLDFGVQSLHELFAVFGGLGCGHDSGTLGFGHLEPRAGGEETSVVSRAY